MNILKYHRITINLLYLLLLACFSQTLNATPKQQYSEAEVVETIAAFMTRQAAIANPEKNPVWPNLDLHRRPMIIRLPGNHYFAFNLLTLDPRWSEYQISDKTVKTGAWPVYHSEED